MLDNVMQENKDRWKEMVKEELTTSSLRFLPYLLNRAVNNSYLERGKMYEEEKDLSIKLNDMKLCSCFPWNAPVSFPNKEFYNLCVDILYDAYIWEYDPYILEGDE